MKLTFDRRYDKWQQYKEYEARCANCMNDAPYDYCCKNYCGERGWCEDCEAECRNTPKLCEK